MIEAYEIGISLALQDGVSEGIAVIRRELATLDQAIAATTSNFARLQQVAGAAPRAPAPPSIPPPRSPAPGVDDAPVVAPAVSTGALVAGVQARYTAKPTAVAERPPPH